MMGFVCRVGAVAGPENRGDSVMPPAARQGGSRYHWAMALAFLGVYVVAGIVFGTMFVARGAGRVDAAAAAAGWGFRILIFPAAMAFWPLLAFRWARRVVPVERSPHRRAAAQGKP